MSLGPVPRVPAHASLGCKLGPRPDRAIEAVRATAPPVPRAPRAKARANSCGALAKAAKLVSEDALNIFGAGATPTRSSELRRPREESPFVFARVNKLDRERDEIENQAFTFGPRRSIVPELREDYGRGHILGREIERNIGVPMGDIAPAMPEMKEPARRNNLQRERQDADQQLEWASAPAPKVQARGRRNVLSREEAEGALECPSVRPVPGAAVSSGAVGSHNRRNILRREQVQEESFPTPRGAGDGYGKRNLLIRECPQAPVAAC